MQSNQKYGSADLQCLDGWSRISPVNYFHTLKQVVKL